MVFKQNIPQPTDIIAQSQRDISENFEQTFDIWGKSPTESENIGDHIPLENPQEENLGKHKKVTLIEQNPIPVASANEAILYSELVNGNTELHYRRNGDATGNQLTSNGGLNVGGLVLRAFVAFDFNGNILNRESLDDEGDTIKIPLSFNVGTITKPDSTKSQWTIPFINSIETENYIWICQSFNNIKLNPNSFLAEAGNCQPSNNSNYSDSVNSNFFNFTIYRLPRSLILDQPATDLGRRMIFQAYTVT